MVENTKKVSFGFPIDIIIEILSRLPAKSLLRFKLVCKTWYALIRSPNFINKHQQTSRAITSILAISSGRMYFYEEGFYKTIDFDSLFLAKRVCFDVVGTNNGLICVFSFMDNNFIIGNPTIREFQRIPSFKWPNMVNDLVFFGFSSFANEYKLVTVIYRISLFGEVVIKAEVYARSTPVWVEIDVKMGRVDNVVHLSYYGTYSWMPVVLNGVFYWEASSSNNARILSFDISEGIVNEINIPTNLVNVEEGDRWRIIEFEQELSLIVYSSDRKFELWVPNESGSSWTWKLTVDDIPLVVDPLENLISTIEVVAYAKDGELLVEDRYPNDVKFLWYDLNTRERKTIPYINVHSNNEFYFYTESLRSAKLRDEVAEED